MWVWEKLAADYDGNVAELTHSRDKRYSLSSTSNQVVWHPMPSALSRETG
jgi:hypothetical protein